MTIETDLQAQILTEARALQAALKTDQDLIDLLRGFQYRNNDQAQKNAFADALGDRGWWFLVDIVAQSSGNVYYPSDGYYFLTVLGGYITQPIIKVLQIMPALVGVYVDRRGHSQVPPHWIISRDPT